MSGPDLSAIINGRCAVASNCGSLVAAGNGQKVRIHAAYAPERYLEIASGIAVKDLTGLKWSLDSSSVAALSTNGVDIMDLNSAKVKCRINNGSGSLGRITTVEFLDVENVLVVWEFGKAKVWNLVTGQAHDLTDFKTTNPGASWSRRVTKDSASTAGVTAFLSREGAEDYLTIAIPGLDKIIQHTKLSTVDVHSLSWSPDGRWLAILDTPTASTSVYIYTSDGHQYRRWPTNDKLEQYGLGVRAVRWSGDSRLLALTDYEHRVTLLDTESFTLQAIVEHTTTVDQRSIASDQQARIWRETVSATNDRTFVLEAALISPVLSVNKPTDDIVRTGVAECCFSRSGRFLASRDERMLTTVWIWETTTVTLHTLLMQHNDIKRISWHPSQEDLLLVDATEGMSYLYDLNRGEPPLALNSGSPLASHSWLTNKDASHPVVLAATRNTFRLLYPYNRADMSSMHDDPFKRTTNWLDEDVSEDSIFDVLSGRKPLPHKTEMSCTDRLDLDAALLDEDLIERLDDTFREKRLRTMAKEMEEIDPLDDSQIF